MAESCPGVCGSASYARAVNGRGKVYLLGAGPGDPELVTMRALRRLVEADVVLYDALVHEELLRHCRPEAELVFVGKRGGHVSERQERINARMVQEARRGRVVARLKGGDPYLFGRGSEEVEHLSEAGVPFEVVPGVPSPLAATAYGGFSLTHRDLASSVAYLTATESEEKDRTSHDWAKLATATQTLVIFMGRRKLASLMALLVQHGRPPETPVALIQWASLPRQRTVVGTVANIADKVAAAELGTPALTIVGQVVQLRRALRWFDTQELFGKRVLVTRATAQAGSLSEQLRDVGAQPVEHPTIRLCPPSDSGPLAAALADLGSYDWAVFTSQNAVDAFFDALDASGGDARRLGGTKIAAVGPKTAKALARRGLRADLVPTQYRGDAAADALVAAAGASSRVLLPRAKVAREVLPERLRAAGHEVDVVPVYENRPPTAEGLAALRAELEAGVDVVTFTSSSTVDNLIDALGDDAQRLLDGVTIASIGPITTATAEGRGLHVDVSATRYTTKGLVEALVHHYGEASE